MENNWSGSIMNILDEIVKLVLLNILWWLFTLLGLGIFGVMPATAAVFLIIRRKMQGKEVVHYFKEFKTIYKESFLSSNIVGLFFLLFGLFLYIDIKILFELDFLISKIVLAIIFMLCMIYFIILVNFFPIYSRYKMTFFNYLKLSFVIGLSNPISTILMALWISFVCLLSIRYTVLIPLLFMAVIAIGVNWLSMKMIEKKLAQNN